MSYQSTNPYTGKLVRQFTNHNDQDVDRILATAHQLFISRWCQNDIDQRLSVLQAMAKLIDNRVDALATLASQEMGKPLVQSKGELKICADIARYYAKNAHEFLAPVSYSTSQGEAWIEHHPIGVILAVELWNFPYYQLMRVLAPNLAAGNTVVAKHSSIVPQCAAAFEQLVLEAGAPPGAWSNLYVTSEQIANIIADSRIQGVALTGSEGAGSAVAAQAGKKLKKSTLKLGGNDVFMVLEDCDLDRAIETGALARLNNAGQVCTGAKRFIVHQNIADAFLAGLVAHFQAVKMGDPLDQKTTLGPLSSRQARDDLDDQVKKALEHGAELYYQSQPLSGDGFFYPPTILTNIERNNPAWYQEFFGPVAQVYIVSNDDEAIKIANDSHYGLGGVVFSQNIERAKRLASRIETGMVFINTLTGSAPELPFGGVKRSGYGRELSDLGIKEFVNAKLVVISRQT